MSTVLVVQHGADDPPGYLGGALTHAGHRLDVIRCHLGELLPTSLAGYAGLVVLGGAMGAYDDAAFGWLTTTKSLLREAVRRDVPTLAVCLGHQLLAVANGGRVTQAAAPQVGLHRVQLTEAGADDTLFATLAPDAPAIHWNNDLVVDLPPGAVLLASTSAGVQAVRLGSQVWGLQFHPEVDLETVTPWAQTDVAAGVLSAEEAAARLADVSAASTELAETWSAFGARFAALLESHTA